jgi:nucleotide-binding universal stress UspA family protein
MDRILVATDFSTRSDRALRRAMLIARRADAALTLLHVVDGDQAQRLIASEQADSWSLLRETAQTITTEDEISAEALVMVGDVDSAIIETAEEIDADLIVLGPHRRRTRDIFIGTIVERVLRRAQRPFLVAAEPPATQYRSTLLALDIDEASKAAARAALAMGVFDNMKVVVMHAFDTPAAGMMRRSLEAKETIDDYVEGERRDAIRQLQDLATEIGLPPARLQVAAINGTAARTILESAKSHDADLVVMGTNQRRGFERLLIGSVTEDVIREGNRDILVVPTEN